MRWTDMWLDSFLKGVSKECHPSSVEAKEEGGELAVLFRFAPDRRPDYTKMWSLVTERLTREYLGLKFVSEEESEGIVLKKYVVIVKVGGDER